MTAVRSAADAGRDTDPDGSRGRRSSRGAPAQALVRTGSAMILYLAAAVAVNWDAWSAGASSHLQAGADQITTTWFLRWLPFALLHGHNPLYTDFGNHPFGVNLLNNTSVPLLGLVATPVTLLAGPVAAFNTLSTLALAGSAASGYCFARRWTVWRPAAFAGGLLYGFSPYEIAQSNGGHLNLTFAVLPPLILLAAYEVVGGRPGTSRAWGVGLGLLVVAQFFVSSEILVSTIVVGACCLLAAAAMEHRSVRTHLRRAMVGGGWAVGVSAVLLAYPVWFALRGPAHINGPIQLVPQAYRADLIGPVVPDVYTWIAPAGLVKVANGFATNPSENGSYLGITLLVTLAVGTVVLWRRNRAVRVAAVGGAAAFVISLGGGLVVHRPPRAVLTGPPLPERLFTKLPLLSNTVPARYSLYVALFAALVLAIVLDRVHAAVATRRSGPRRPPSRAWSWATPALIALLCLLPLAPDGPVSGVTAVSTPSYFTSPAATGRPPGRVTVLYPYPSAATPEGQLWQATAGLQFRSPGGYFLVPDGPSGRIGFSPVVGYGADTLTARTFISLHQGHPPPETVARRAALAAQLGRWRVTSLVAVFGTVPQPAAVQFLTWLVGRPPVRTGGVEVWELPTTLRAIG